MTAPITDPRRLLAATCGSNGIGGAEVQVGYHGCGRWSTQYFDPITRELLLDHNGKPEDLD